MVIRKYKLPDEIMPAVLAHWVVAKDVAWRFINSERDGYQFFQGSKDDQYEQVSKYIYLGACGPDIPYYYDADIEGKLKHTVGKSEYADLYHYNKQSEFILQLVIIAKGITDAAHQQRTIAYVLGHATHLAVDSMVHPYVNCFAGAYHKQTIDDIHKISEVHQDSWLAQKYFRRKYIDEGDSWTKFLPDCIQVGVPLLAYTQVNAKTKEVFSDIVAAFKKTHGCEMSFEYIKDSYENMYDIAIDEGYDKALDVIPKEPHESLVQHERLKSATKYCPDLLRNKAVDASEKACNAVIDLYNSACSEDNLNEFRTEVKNWNMDTGYWIDVTLKDNKLKIIWRHRWC